MANLAKYESYRYAFRRIKEALAAGYSLEATALCESIISDRLTSMLLGRGATTKKKPERLSLGDLVSLWRKHERNGERDLRECVDRWRNRRNASVHAACKSAPGTPTKAVGDFLRESENCAREGERLAGEVRRLQRSTDPRRNRAPTEKKKQR